MDDGAFCVAFFKGYFQGDSAAVNSEVAWQF